MTDEWQMSGWGESEDLNYKPWVCWIVGGLLLLAILSWVRDCNQYEKEMVEYEAGEKARQYD